MNVQLYQHLFLIRLFFELSCLGSLVKIQLTITITVYFWALNSIPLIHKFLLIPVTHHLDYCSFVVSFESGKCESSNFVLLFKIVLTLLGPLYFRMNFSISLSIFSNKESWNFLRDCIQSAAQFGSIAILTIFSLSVHKHGIF